MIKENEKTKTSLRIKIWVSSVSALLVLALIMGTICVCVVGTLSQDNVKKNMSQLCEKEALRFENKLNQVYQSVEMIYEYTKDLRPISGGSALYSDEEELKIKDFSYAVASKTEGAMAVYFRYDPKVSGSGVDGFFLCKNAQTGHFEDETITDILDYNSTDVEHVGWFYTPKENGEPLWMTPYYNKNLNVYMISYIIPMYRTNGEFYGVVGMDIDFEQVLKEAQDVNLYEKAYVACVDLKEHLLYYQNSDQALESEKISNDFYNHMTTINKRDEMLEITDRNATVSFMSCKKLSNGMVMYVSVPRSEINNSRNYLIMACVMITVLVFVISSIVIWKFTKKMLGPLKKLSEITDEYAEGNWSNKYIFNSGDELQKLSEAIARMAENTQEYIQKLNQLARTDAMTGIGNKTSYLEVVSELEENRYKEYAVVVLDLNYLKKTNDTYGHEAGDVLIKEAAGYISRVFSNSPVFRIGGDEFVAILIGKDYENRMALLDEFEAQMGEPIPENKDMVLSISFGMAQMPGDHTVFDNVYKLADERMYQKKNEMKKKGKEVSNE